MAKGQNANKQLKDLWKPGPLSGYPASSENKRLNRQIIRRKSKEELKRKSYGSQDPSRQE